MSLLSICQNACIEAGLKEPPSIIGSSDRTAKRCLLYADRTGRELVRKSVDFLVKEHTFTTVNGTEGYDMPSDFDHFLHLTNWNRTTDRKQFSIQAPEWQLLRSGLASVSINDRYRIRGADRQMIFEPIPTAAETIAFEYVSKNYCEDATGTGQDSWQADTDVGVIDEEVFELGVTWRLKRKIGEPYADEKAEYENVCNTMIAQISPHTVVLDERIPEYSNLPDANFPAS